MTPVIHQESKTREMATQTEITWEPPSEEDLSCPITKLRDPKVVSLACGHIFSALGINSWLAKHKACPVCTQPASRVYTHIEMEQLVKKLAPVPKKLMQISEENKEYLEANSDEKESLEDAQKQHEEKINEALRFAVENPGVEPPDENVEPIAFPGIFTELKNTALLVAVLGVVIFALGNFFGTLYGLKI